MVGDTQLVGFIIVSLVVLIIPGPGVLYVVARSLSQGHLAAVISAAGLAVGVSFHIFAAGIGLSAILLTSATAFSTIKYLGGAYLIYLGIQAIRRRNGLDQSVEVGQMTLRRLFLDGVVVSAFNPKITVFFLAFLPQFVSLGATSPQSQIVMLGLIYACLAFVTDSCYGLFAASIKRFLHQKLVDGPAIPIVSGSLMIGLGAHAMMSTSRQ